MVSVNCANCANEILTVPCPECKIRPVPKPERDMPSICGKCYVNHLKEKQTIKHADQCYKNLEKIQKGLEIEGNICVCPLQSI